MGDMSGWQSSNGSASIAGSGLHTWFHNSASRQHISHMVLACGGGGGITFEGEQQAIMRTRPLPFRPSYSSLVSVLSLYGITGGTALHQTRPQHEPQSTRRVFGVKTDRREESVH